MISFPTVDCLAVGLYIMDSRGETPAASAGLFCAGLIMLEFEMTEGAYDAPVPCLEASALRSKNDSGLVDAGASGSGVGCAT